MGKCANEGVVENNKKKMLACFLSLTNLTSRKIRAHNCRLSPGEALSDFGRGHMRNFRHGECSAATVLDRQQSSSP